MRRNETQVMRALLALSVVMLQGCATPEHTNTLIFGTTTRVAIDVSQEPTGSLGVTIGYKRNEAVWMPLLANQASNDEKSRVPAKCNDDACRKFVGTTGAGGAAGGGANDTYSVLATFSGQVGGAAGGGGSAEAKAGLAQYFATGMAARLLAQYGGAALVNPNVQESTKPSAIEAGVAETVSNKRKNVASIAAKLSNSKGEIQGAKVTTLLQTPPADGLSAAQKNILQSFKTRSELESYLSDGPEKTVDTLLEASDKL